MYAEVIVDILNESVDKIFEYSFFGDAVKVGSRVIVPFGKKYLEGIVVKIKDKCIFDSDKIKNISRVIEDIPCLTDETFDLMQYVCKTCYVTKAQSLRLFLPSEMRGGKVKEKTISYVYLDEKLNYFSAIESLKKTAIKQKECLEYLYNNGKSVLSEMNNKFGSSAVNSLVNKNFVEISKEKSYRLPYKDLEAINKKVELTKAQDEAFNCIKSTEKNVSLLHGVTGSGKTEVYLNLIDDAIKNGKTAIMLVPEIALTPQMLRQLRARFGDLAAILHSGLSAGERFDEWWRLRVGDAKIAIGARSAVFAPLTNLGVIIIDEEHDGSYTSESSPRYNTIDIALHRAEYNNCKLVLGSATPSIDSFYKAKKGEYNYISMPLRVNKKPLPNIEVVDMKKEIRHGNDSPFSQSLKQELEKCLNNNEQAIIFLNQRGYSKNVICTECGHVFKCDSCDVSLTYHKEDNSLLCHYCGAKYKMVDACTNCGSKFLRYGGFGTEKVVFELKKLFPNAKILRMDRDTTQNKESHFNIINEFANGKADILVGTQMVAKGHDFPNVTLVGILDADMSLHFSDFRSGERTFQLLTQVSGRCGRAEKSGNVILQTYNPTNEILNASIKYDYEGLYEHEISVRSATGFPPFTDIVRVMICGENEESTLLAVKAIYNTLSRLYEDSRDKFRFFGCMISPIKKIQNKYRYQVLMRINSGNRELLDVINSSIFAYNCKSISVYMEINPNNLS